MTYSVLSEARVKGSVADLQPEERSYCTFWTRDGNLEGWTTILDLDIVGAWNGFLFGTKREATTGEIGPTDPFTAIDASVNDRIFFRLKYDKHPKNANSTNVGKIRFITTSDPVYNDEKSITFEVIPDGKWHFYELNMSAVQTWVGNINNIRFFPCTNGARNDEFFLNFFEIGTNNFTFSFENSKAGLPARATGATALTSNIEIIKDVNDRLIVNIDDYGDVSITLTPQVGTPTIIARDISLQLGKVGIGGYIRSDAFIENDTNLLKIESGIRAADSSIVIKTGTNSVGADIGFFDISGNAIYTATAGAAPDSSYIPLSSYRLTTLEILSLFDNDFNLPSFTINPQTYVIEAGRRDFGTTNRRLTSEIVIEGRGTDFQGQLIQTSGSFVAQSKTLIDLNHPFTDDGTLDKIFMNGIANTDGSSKWKIFRPKLDGTLTLVTEGEIGETPSLGTNEVLTAEAGVYVADVSTQDIKVRRGDLLGIFNVDLHTGSFGSVKNDAMYYEITGDVTGTITPSAPTGAGESGLPFYARGAVTKNKAVVDIDFGKRFNLDTLTVHGSEDLRDLEYNVATATSATFSATSSGIHTICYNTTPSVRTCINRTNTTFNLNALNDNVIFAENGIAGFGDGGPSGLGGADADGATYFYVNGDGEFLGINEFVLQAPTRYEFTRDPYGIDCFFSSSTPRLDKPIGKAVIFFKDKKNQRSWQIETLTFENSKVGNGSQEGFELVPAITAVEIDDKRIIPPRGLISTKTDSDAQGLLLKNPVLLDTIAADGTRNPQLGTDFDRNAGELGGVNIKEQVTFHEFQWNRFQWEFDAIRTVAFRYYSDFHWSTKISEFQIFAVSASKESLGDNSQILFSSDGESFITAALLSSSTTTASYKLGNSPQFLRLIFRPTLQLSINEAQVNFEEDQVCFGEEGRLLGALSVEDSKRGSTGTATPLKITNNTGEESDLSLDIPSDINSARQLLYFSKLNQQSDITVPGVGPPGRVDFVSDKVLLEEENIAQNAQSYGLVNLVSGTSSTFVTRNLLTNAGFETGDLTGWELLVLQSGTGVTNSGTSFGVPSVRNIDEFPDEDVFAGELQTGNYTFGVSINSDIPEHNVESTDNFENIEFELSQVVDLTEYAESVDIGTAIASLDFKYCAYFSGTGPTVRYVGAPTLSGAQAAANTNIDGYGSNLLRSTVIPQSDTATLGNPDGLRAVINTTTQAILKENTRFLRVEIDATMTNGLLFNFNQSKWMTLWMDDWDLTLELPSPTTAKWYKSWNTGVGDPNEFVGFTDSSFTDIPASDFVAVTGSNHWWQPFDSGNQTAAPNGATKVQTQDSSNAFAENRFLGIQSFRRMTISDPGLLGMQWEAPRDLAGFKIAFHHEEVSNTTFASQWPIRFQVGVLKTAAELGREPSVYENTHFKLMDTWVSVDPRATPVDTLGGTSLQSDGPFSRVSTFLFSDGPVTTQGLHIFFTRNCDRFERAVHANSTDFSQITGCPSDNQLIGSDWASSLGIGVSYFIPLDSTNATNLPIDNVREFQRAGSGSEVGAGNIYAAVDLGRPHDIDLSSELFELIASTPSLGEWGTSNALFSATDTDDPNQVVWAGSSSNARWIRFITNSVAEFENPEDLFVSDIVSGFSFVKSIPQATLNQARIYPDITTTFFPSFGYNSEWVSLGTNLSDNNTSTFISGSDFPVIALDLRAPYVIANDTDVVRRRHDVVTPSPEFGGIDRSFWLGNDEDFWTYSAEPFDKAALPETVEFRSFGAGVPDFPVRWVAVKISDQLEFVPSTGDPPRQYSFDTLGLTLFDIKVKPRNPELPTENAHWFSNKKSSLNDISTFKFSLGLPIDVLDGTDYGSAAGITGISSDTSADNLGGPYRAFDGQFDEFASEFDGWGVQVRDIVTGNTNAADDFPHSLWRVFRNVQTDTVETKEVKSIKILGFNERFYPTTFTFQKLLLNSDESIKDPNLNSSWENIDEASFSSIDTFQEGLGFTHIFPVAISAKGIRLRITASVSPDDSVETSIDPDTGTFQSTNPQSSGPQTRIAEVIIYEELLQESVIQGSIEVDHMLSASVSSTTATAGHAVDFIKDDNPNSYWRSTGFSDILTISLKNSRPISRLEWSIDPNLSAQSASESVGAPHNFTLKAAASGGILTLLVGSGIETSTFSSSLGGAPVTAKDFTLEITEPQGIYEDANSIIINELRLVETIEQTLPLVTVESSTDRRPGSTSSTSTKIIYASNSDAVAAITADGLDMNNDEVWSQRDFFSLWVFINDINSLDTTFGNIKLGNTSETFYRWEFNNMSLQTGWNELKLQFKSAEDTSPIPFQPGFQFNENVGDSQVDFLTDDVVVTSNIDGSFSQRILQSPGIRFFELEFRGTKASSSLEIILDDFRFIRNKFDDVCKFLPSLYLNNSEVFTIFLEGLDIATGTVEFWFQPDWDTSGRLSANRPIIPALFRIMRPDGKFLSLFYRPNQGFVVMIFDGTNLLQFVTNVSQYRFSRFDTFHVALVWSALGDVVGPGGSGATLALYIDGAPVFGTTEGWDSVREGGSTVMFGGEVGQRFAATPNNSTSLLFTAVPTQPAKNTASSWALLENLKIYNYPKSDFSDRLDKNLSRTQLLTPAEMIEISVSGTDGPFYGVGSDQLPLSVFNVPDGGSATVHIRTILPKDLDEDVSRDASLLVRWRTPLKDCN